MRALGPTSRTGRRGLLFGSLAYVLLQGWIGPGHGGDSFYGYRYSLELIVGAAPAYAVTAPRMGRIARVLMVPVVALQFAAFAFGSVTDMFLPMADVWTRNTFLVHGRERRPRTVSACIQVDDWVTCSSRRFTRRVTGPWGAAVAQPAPPGSRPARFHSVVGTVSSHSVP